MDLEACIPNIGKELSEEMAKFAQEKSFPAGKMVVEQGEVLRFLPVVLEGSIKVFSHESSIQFLLYFIGPGETCIFSFAHIFDEKPVSFSGIAEVDSVLLLLPIHKVKEWYRRYPRFNELLIKAYQKHYEDLLHTTKQVLCYNLEDRLMTYLQKKVEVGQSEWVSLSHREIALDLGTSREVITRLLRKVSNVGKIRQEGRKIKVLL